MAMLPPAGRPSLPRATVVQPPASSAPAPKSRASKSLTKRPPQGALTRAQREVSPAEELAFATLETELGGRAQLISALSAANLPKDLDQALGLMADPLHQHESLGKVCALAGVKVSKLLEALQAASRTRGQLLAHARIATRMPDVAAQVMDDATAGWRDCLECMGLGRRAAPTEEDPAASAECGVCRGRGKVYHQPDHDVQKTALQISGLLQGSGKGGVSLNVLQANNQVNPGNSGNYDTLVGMMDQVLFGSGRERLSRTAPADVVEGEAVDGE